MARNPFHNSDSSGGESSGAMVLDPETGEMIAAPPGGGTDGSSNAMQSDSGLHNSSSSSSSSAQVGILPAV